MLRAEFHPVKSLSVRRRRRSRWPWIAAGLLLIAVPLSIFAVFFQRSLQFSIDDIGAMPQRATVFDMDGKPYARLYGENRIVVPLDQVSPKFINALLAREDSRFYRHFGVDPIGVARAAFRNLTSRSKKEGASTLTQQLARNSLPLGGQTLSRKLLEACIALRIEQRYSKKEILEHYINRIYYGGGLYGIEAASLTYFGKSAKDLDLSESALMAGLIRSPNRFSPIRNPKGAAAERDVVLGRMVLLGFITQAEADRARESVVSTTGKPRISLYQENYAMDAIKRDLDTILEQQQQDDGGLQIYATIDPELQAAATKALEETLTKIESQPGWEHPRKAQYNKDGANAGGAHRIFAGRARGDRQPHRRDSRAGRRARFRAEQIQPRHPRAPPGRLVLQAVHLRERLPARHAARRGGERRDDRTRRAARRERRGQRLEPGQFRRPVRRHPARRERAHPLAQHHVRARRRTRRPRHRHEDRAGRGAHARRAEHADRFPRRLRGLAQGSHRRLHRVPEQWRAPAAVLDRAHRRRGGREHLSRGAPREGNVQPRRGLADEHDSGKSPDRPGHGGARARRTWFQASRRRKDRHDK